MDVTQNDPQGGGGLDHIAAPLRTLAVPLASLNLDAANARRHDEANLAAIRASLERWGQRLPIVVQREGMVVRAGNGRVEVARSMGWTHIAAVVVDESAVEATAFAIADNRTAELATWDDGTLAKLLESLPQDAQGATGFDDGDMRELLARLAPEVTEDEAPAPLAAPVSRTGDLWVLGGHRLLCGDSTNGGDVALCLDGATPFIMVTDPPYGVEYDPEWRLNAGLNKEHQTRAEGKVSNDDTIDWTTAWQHFPGPVAYVWHGGKHAGEVAANLHTSGFEIRAQIVWAKPSLVISRGHYHWQHEPCWYAVRKGQTSKWCGDRKQSTVWDIANMHRTQGDVDDGKTNHSTQKPVECMARPIRNHGGKDDHVYDPFVGSGTTIVACEQLGRTCYAIEIDPRYVDVAIRRWEKLTGKQATHADTGKTWAQTAEERGVALAGT